MQFIISFNFIAFIITLIVFFKGNKELLETKSAECSDNPNLEGCGRIRTQEEIMLREFDLLDEVGPFDDRDDDGCDSQNTFCDYNDEQDEDEDEDDEVDDDDDDDGDDLSEDEIDAMLEES